ncbi:MAG TPA: hypothetical protein VHP11_15970, partial [Tepidisphaeraceae bacterium]|nr:hypothetical protein [Tepidisphaeraceae bacterium]
RQAYTVGVRLWLASRAPEPIGKYLLGDMHAHLATFCVNTIVRLHAPEDNVYYSQPQLHSGWDE